MRHNETSLDLRYIMLGLHGMMVTHSPLHGDRSRTPTTDDRRCPHKFLLTGPGKAHTNMTNAHWIIMKQCSNYMAKSKMHTIGSKKQARQNANRNSNSTQSEKQEMDHIPNHTCYAIAFWLMLPFGMMMIMIS